jgi:hypothetical protein
MEWRSRIRFFAYERCVKITGAAVRVTQLRSFAELRIKELFDIIVDMPDSKVTHAESWHGAAVVQL